MMSKLAFLIVTKIPIQKPRMNTIIASLPAPRTVDIEGSSTSAPSTSATTLILPSLLPLLWCTATSTPTVMTTRRSTVSQQAPSIGEIGTTAKTLTTAPMVPIPFRTFGALVTVEILPTRLLHRTKKLICLKPSSCTTPCSSMR